MMRGLGISATLTAAFLVTAACTSSGDTGTSTRYLACGDGGTCPPGYTCSEGICAHEGSPPSVENPTGSCKATESGARPGYSVPDSGTLWLPDCKNPLSREYWRVYAVAPHSAYVLPRPDGAYELTLVCNTDEHPLRPLVDRYLLCNPAGSQADVDVVNDMRPEDALKITHFLHTQLLFETPEGIPGVWVRPFAIPSDVLDACALHSDTNSAAVQSDCELTQQLVDTGVEPAPDYSGSATEMAVLLNELYGIGNCASDEAPRRVCTECGPLDACSNVEIRCSRRCQSDPECGDAGICLQGFCPGAGTICG